MLQPISVSIVIPNLNGQIYLTPLLAHLAHQTQRDFELIFVDNGSTDNSVQIVTSRCQEHKIPLQLIQNITNHGFAAANNQGFAVAQGEWIVTLNNDTRPEPEWLSQLVRTACNPPTLSKSKRPIGMVASKMLFAHAPDMIDSAGIAIDPVGIAWNWRGGEQDIADETEVVEVFGPCGGAALYSKAMLDEIGGFDEDFFAYMEDVDLAWRARLAGWRCLFQPQARLLHVHSATLGDASPFKRFLLGRNKVWMIAKNYPHSLLWRYLPAIIGYDLMATVYAALTRGDFVTLKGRVIGLWHLPAQLRKRRQILNTWQDTDNFTKTISPLVPPWAVSKRYAHLAGK